MCKSLFWKRIQKNKTKNEVKIEIYKSEKIEISFNANLKALATVLQHKMVIPAYRYDFWEFIIIKFCCSKDINYLMHLNVVLSIFSNL